MRFFAAIATLLTVLVLATPAVAQDEVIAPPGNSGVEEYLEVVPGAGGDKPANPARGGGGSGGAAPTPAEALGSDNAKALESLGADGKAAAAAAAAGSPTDRKTARERARSNVLGESKAGGSSSIATRTSGDKVTSVARALGGDGGGMGLLFPILLGLTLSLALALGVGRMLRRG